MKKNTRIIGTIFLCAYICNLLLFAIPGLYESTHEYTQYIYIIIILLALLCVNIQKISVKYLVPTVVIVIGSMIVMVLKCRWTDR